MIEDSRKEPSKVSRKIMIIFHSQSGHTEAMARRVADGVVSIDNVELVLKRASEATLDDLLQCDGLAIGTPEYFGYMSGMIKDFFDRTYEQARGHKEVFKKPYVVFVSAGNDGTQAVHQVERIALGYQFKKVYDPVVAVGELTQEDLDRCLELGQTLAAGVEAGIY